MTSDGTVRLWQAEEGWGVIDSAATPGGCWAHFSAVLGSGYRTLEAGGAVTFTFEAAEQDGYPFRAVEVWAGDRSPVQDADGVAGASSAYRSELPLTFDDDDDDGGGA
jgi:cold shock protein